MHWYVHIHAHDRCDGVSARVREHRMCLYVKAGPKSNEIWWESGSITRFLRVCVECDLVVSADHSITGTKKRGDAHQVCMDEVLES